MVNSLMLTVLNFVLCSAGAWMCLCRLAKMSASTTKRPIRAQYTIWFALFCADAISYTFDEPVTLIQILMTACIVVHLAIGFTAWRAGAPGYANKAAV